jgi:hypothetical protein
MRNASRKRSAALIPIALCLGASCGDNPMGGNRDVPGVDVTREVIDQTSLDSLSQVVRALSGDAPVVIDGRTEVIRSRHRDYLGNDLAANYINAKLTSYGLVVVDQWVSGTARNVYALQTGSRYPNRKYIFGAHYDSMPDSTVSPGADDNASGTAAVLEAARVLSRYTPEYTIMYALWDEEEEGAIGSGYYAFNANRTGETIEGMINVDMIGWDSDNDGEFFINVRDISSSTLLANAMVDVNTRYGIGLSPRIVNPGSGSDNLPFWFFGFGAIGVEELYGEDWNDYYHDAGDRLSQFNPQYFQNCARLLSGTLASLAGLQE